MTTINTDAIARVAQALDAFRTVHNNRVAYVRSHGVVTNTGPVTSELVNGLTDYAFDTAAEGTALARAVAALLGEPELQELIPRSQRPRFNG